MSYIGNEPLSVAFLTDTFSGNGSTVAFTMSVAPANTSSILVAITGVVQDPSTYSVSGTTLTFSAAPPTGTSNISVRYLGIPASGVTTTAYRTVTDTTATSGQTTFTIPSYTVGYVDVFRNGVRLAAADFTATTGTTIVLASAASAGDTITTVSFYVSSVLNAIQQYNGLSVNQVLTTPTANTLTSASGSSLQLQTNGGTTAVTIDTAQNMSLGGTPSAWQSGRKALQVGNASINSNANSQNQLGANFYYDGTNNKYISSDFSTVYQQLSGQHQWYTAASGTAGNTITFTQAMTLDASGNWLLGTTSNIGSARASIVNSSGVTLNLEKSGGSSLQFTYAGGTTDAQLSGGGSGSLVIYTGNTLSEKARIDANGHFLLGTTDTSISSGVGAKFIAGTTQPYMGYVWNQSGGGSNYHLYNTNATNNGYRFYVSVNGGISNYSGNNINLSDARTKTNIELAGSYLEKVCAIPVKLFNYKDEPEGEQQTLGVIAQDVEAVAPELVNQDGWLGEAPEGEAPLKSIYTTDMMFALMKAIQEQQAIITQLQADVATLKGQA